MKSDPASRDFMFLPRAEQARIYAGLGWSIEALMEEYCAPRVTVEAWLARAPAEKPVIKKRVVRVTEPAKRPTPPRHLKILDLHNRGMTRREIIKKTGLPQSTVYRVIADHSGNKENE